MSEAEQTTLHLEIQSLNQPRKKKRRKRPTSPCQYEGCNQWAWAQGYCDPHYQKLKKQGVLKTQRIMKDDVARFHTKYTVHPVTGCWEWTGPMHHSGYGNFGVTENGKGVTYRAHCWAYEFLVGPIPDGQKVLHDCDNTRCCRPSHLVLGTGSDNMRHCVARGRHSTQNGNDGPKLTDAMVLNIRVMYARGLLAANGTKANPSSLRNIASIYGVKPETVRGIVKGTKHLNP